MLVLGVTGDVGAGKSTVTKIFQEFGAHVIDADGITHEIWKRPEVLHKAIVKWGEDILLPDGRIDAPGIASRVFTDEDDYKWLCSLLHPLVRSEMEKRVSDLEGLVVAEIPLLFENGVPSWIDLTCYVRTSMERRLSRNRTRGWDQEEIRRREKFLLPREEKMGKADLIIDNESDLGKLRAHLKALSERLLLIASLCVIEIGPLSMEDMKRILDHFSDDPDILGMRCDPGDIQDQARGSDLPGHCVVFLAAGEHCSAIRAATEELGLSSPWHIIMSGVNRYAGLVSALLSDMIRS